MGELAEVIAALADGNPAIKPTEVLGLALEMLPVQNADKFGAGTIVRLNSGGPDVTIVEESIDGWVSIAWFDEANQWNERVTRRECLYEPPPHEPRINEIPPRFR